MTLGDELTSDLRRVAVLAFALLVISGALFWRVVDLHVFSKDFLQQQGDARYLRVVSEPAHRGVIMDRNGEPLAISTPVDTLWADPQELLKAKSQWPELARAVSLDLRELKKKIISHKNREFVYLKRAVPPQIAQSVMALEIPGVNTQREYRRYYPSGEVTSHLVGVTDIDDAGQEGVELAFDDWLQATDGSKRVIKDRLGRVVENVERVTEPRAGQDLILSIDRRIQYLTYRELKAAVNKHRAVSGSAVVIDSVTGEILAMVNQPSYNPNNRKGLKGDYLRNRAVTDVFEPGSTIKPFTVAAALEAGKFSPDTIIDTTPGRMRVGRKVIHDAGNYGFIDVSTVIKKSSNVGTTKIALSISSQNLWDVFARAGFGVESNSGFPGEAAGHLSDYTGWRKLERATLSFGYGISVTALQLARAYTVFANDGMLLPTTLVRETSYPNLLLPASERVMSPETARQVLAMLEHVVEKGGTGTKARVKGYRVAGKTGTAKVSGKGGYLEDSYHAVFAGIAPVSKPRLVMAVVINQPQGEKYGGGAVAAPVFSGVMKGALRLLDVPPDDSDYLAGMRLAHLDQQASDTTGE